MPSEGRGREFESRRVRQSFLSIASPVSGRCGGGLSPQHLRADARNRDAGGSPADAAGEPPSSSRYGLRCGAPLLVPEPAWPPCTGEADVPAPVLRSSSL